MFNAILVRPGEYMVRVNTRATYLSFLRESIEKVFERKGLKAQLKVVDNVRILIDPLGSPLDQYLSILRYVPGISSFSPVVGIGKDYSVLIETISNILVRDRVRRFKIELQGSLGVGRKELTALISKAVVDETGAVVDLVEPEAVIGVDVRTRVMFVYNKVYKGMGGLPYGIQGCGVVLFSGGVDSALASIQAVKRGVRVIPVFVDMSPYWSPQAVERAMEGLKLLAEKTPWDRLKAYIVKNASRIVANAEIPLKYRCLACKATMYRIASLIAEKENCDLIITGESLGQVASQTSSNLKTLTRLVDKPVTRPLIFIDKEEIIEASRKIGFSVLSREVGECKLKPDSPATFSGKEVRDILAEYLKQAEKDLENIIHESEVVYL
ncbi:tRNA sulfurtransferase [Thermosphaera chiliense]|uniref:tRNA sulfurtransferase n=1 Tax=Thermosphaera chiliense TaxID=3402707 RepID=A0A7M1UQN3_9CREN|nr:THUMP domain-containing protein [Thermosphaera aggregans]QOR93827.1 tRNA sulfurtransferase [Thermosphaera aggregans]